MALNLVFINLKSFKNVLDNPGLQTILWHHVDKQGILLFSQCSSRGLNLSFYMLESGGREHRWRESSHSSVIWWPQAGTLPGLLRRSCWLCVVVRTSIRCYVTLEVNLQGANPQLLCEDE
jgi:hypothetical protein